MTRMAKFIATLGSLALSLSAEAATRPGRQDVSTLPPVAQATISAAVGKNNSSYYAKPSKQGFQLHSASQKLWLDFTRREATLRADGFAWNMALAAYGRGLDLAPAPQVEPRASRNRVEYRHGAVNEWYKNGPLGMEQGFTVQSRLGASDSQPFTIALSLPDNVQASVDRSRTTLTLTGADDRARIRYAGLTATDANGKELKTWLQTDRKQLLVKVDDAGALYPIVIDPIIQLAELASTASELTYTVGTSGSTVVASDGGTVYVFVKPSTGWTNMTQTATLTPSDSPIAFGASVAISGNTIAVGAPTQCQGIFSGDPGAVYVFTKPSGGWINMTETAKLTASDGVIGDCLGQSVAIGTSTIVAGASGKNIGSNEQQGMLYVFVSKGRWKSTTQTAELTSSNGAAFDFMGSNVAITVSSTSATIATGVYNSRSPEGSVYVFSKPATGWANANETAQLTVPGSVTFGTAVGISGTTLVAGDPEATVGSNSVQGAAYVFSEPATGWATTSSYTAELTASDGSGFDQFGTAVAAAGSSVYAGAPYNALGGSIYKFTKPKAGWQTTSKFNAKLTPSDLSGDGAFAQGIAASGSYVVGGGGGNGTVYVFGP